MNQRQYNKVYTPSWTVYAIDVKSWQEAVKSGMFNSIDGIGYWMKDGMISSDEVLKTPMEDATDVVWFSK